MAGQSKRIMAQLATDVRAAMAAKGYDPIIKQIELSRCLEEMLVATHPENGKPVLQRLEDQFLALKLLLQLHQGLTPYFAPALRAMESQQDIEQTHYVIEHRYGQITPPAQPPLTPEA